MSVPRRLVLLAVCLALFAPAVASAQFMTRDYVDRRLPSAPEVDDVRGFIDIFLFGTGIDDLEPDSDRAEPVYGEPVEEGSRAYVPVRVAGDVAYGELLQNVRMILDGPLRLWTVHDLHLQWAGDGKLALDATFHAHYLRDDWPFATRQRRVIAGEEEMDRSVRELESLLAAFEDLPMVLEDFRIGDEGFHLTGRIVTATLPDLHLLIERFGAEVTALDTSTEGPCTRFDLRGRTLNSDTDYESKPDYTGMFDPKAVVCDARHD